MTASLALAALLSLQAPQGAQRLFEARSEAGPDGAPRIVVAADSRRIDCMHALEELSVAAGWNLVVETTPLEDDLRFQTVDLNLADQDARIVAQLIAVAAGADSIFAAAQPAAGTRPTLHVVRAPTPDTESGRQRLRTLAGQWYRSLLRDELQYDPLVQAEGVEVRMNLGQLLVDSGDFGGAIAAFAEAYEKRPHDRAAEAMLRIAECHLDLARGQADRELQAQQCASAEEWMRRLLERLPSAPEVSQAVVLLGRAMLGRARSAPEPAAGLELALQCRAELSARIVRLSDSAQALDVWLLIGEAHFLAEDAERALETMLTVRESPAFADMSPRQLLDYHFLLGYGSLGTGRHEVAMRSLEWFMLHAEADPRRGLAYVLLAESYLGAQRFVQARAASVEARTRHLGTMPPAWRQRTLRTWARTALALGEKEGAFLELEELVMRGEEPELALFLVDELLADRQWQRAISIAQPMSDAAGAAGDGARFRVVKALYEQAVASRNFDEFPQQAVALAPRISDPELRSRTATMIGDAYTRLGRLEHAADAYRGILR